MNSRFQAAGSAPVSDAEREGFIAAFEDALGPLLKLGLYYGVSAADMAAALMRAGLSTMACHIRRSEGRPPTDSRMACYLGISKNAFRAVADEVEARSRAEKRLRPETLSAILGTWHSDPMYASVYDMARDLEIGSPDRPNTFAGLVDKVAPGTDAILALHSLISSGCVEHLDGGYVRARARAYFLPSRDHESRLRRMGATLRQFNEVFFRNLTSEDRLADGLLERTLVSDSRISESGVRQFHLAATAAVDKLLADLDATLSAIGRELSQGEGKLCGLGVYLFDDADRPVPSGHSGFPIDLENELNRKGGP